MMCLSPQTLFMLFNKTRRYKSLPLLLPLGHVGSQPALPEGRGS